MGILGDIARGVADNNREQRIEGFQRGYDKARAEIGGEAEELKGKVERLRRKNDELERGLDAARKAGRDEAAEEAKVEFVQFIDEIRTHLRAIREIIKGKFGE
jgi:hypothetical protein